MLKSDNFKKADWRGLISYLEREQAFESRSVITKNFQDYYLFYVYGIELDAISPLISFNQVAIPSISEYAKSGKMWLVLPKINHPQNYIANCEESNNMFGDIDSLVEWHETISIYLADVIEFDCIRLEYYQLSERSGGR
jgi:hypothetical protein